MNAQSPFGLLTMCVNRIRDLLIAKDLQGQGTGALASALGKPDWQVKNYARWADGFSQAVAVHFRIMTNLPDGISN